MARKEVKNDQTNGRRTNGTGYDGNRLKWVDGYINDEDKKWLDAHAGEVGEYVLKIIDEQAEGYKISCKFDINSSKYQATLLPDSPDCPNSGFGLSHRANDPTVALFVLSYKHFIKFDRRWGEIVLPSEAGSLWD